MVDCDCPIGNHNISAMPHYIFDQFATISTMNADGLLFWAAAGIVVAAVSLGLNHIAVHTAFRMGFIAYPNAVSRHGRPVPLLGGAAIFLAAAPMIFLISWLMPTWEFFVAALSLIVFLGLLKDRGHSIPPLWQLGWQAAAGVILYAGGLSISTGVNPAIDCVATMVLGVAIINGVNFLDVQDGLAGGAVGIILTSFAAIALIAGAIPIAALSFLLACSIAGFLALNLPPARLFMGDAGSFGLGISLFTIAIALMPSFGERSWITLIPLSLPILELLFTSILRIYARRPVLIGDGRHISTVLHTAGASNRFVLATIYFVATIGGAFGVALAAFG